MDAKPNVLARYLSAAIFAAIANCGAHPCQAQKASPPIKVNIVPSREVAAPGDAIAFTFQALDRMNRPVAVPADLRIEFGWTTPDGKTRTAPAIIRAGKSAGITTSRFRKPGIISCTAETGRLLPGYCFVRVREGAPPPKRTSVRVPASQLSPLKPAPGGSSPAALAPSSTDRMLTRDMIAFAPRASDRPERHSAPPTAGGGDVYNDARSGGGGAADPGASGSAALVPPMPTPASATPQQVRLTIPERRHRADGVDAARITAWVTGETPTEHGDLRLVLASSRGDVRPVPLVIPSGGEQASVDATSMEPGDAEIDLINSTPRVEVSYQKNVRAVSFVPAIAKLIVRVSPPLIRLVDTATVKVQTADAKGRPLATDTPVRVSLSIEGPPGLADLSIEIPAGAFEQRMLFTPERTGVTRIVAQAPDLDDGTAKIETTLPIGLITVAAIGALGGGLLAFLAKRDAMGIVLRLLVGLLTGLVFYWACLYLALTPVLPHSVAVNPFTAFCAPLIGGWLGTETLRLILKRFGIDPTGGGPNAPGHG